MRRNSIITALAIFALLAMPLDAQFQTPRVSQKATTSQTVGFTDIEVTYSRPGVKDRTIWGGLVPHGEVWRTGANEATTISFSQDVVVAGHPVPAGTYALFTIPEENRWTVILNSDHSQWGSGNYDEEKNVARFEAEPRRGPHTEWMTFSFPEISDDSATLELAWEGLRIPIEIEVDTDAAVLGSARSAISAMDNWRTPYRAATWGLSNEAPTEEIIEWSAKAVALEENYATLSLHARALQAAGRTKDARAFARRALEAADEMERRPDTSELEAILRTL